MPSSLSILIPTYSRARWLEVLLRAIAADPTAAAGDIPILVSDNASPDNTAETVRFVQRELPGLDLRLKVQDENVGPIVNIEWLVQAAETDYVWIIGDDDRPLDGAIDYVLRTLQEHDPAVLHLPYNDSPCPPAIEWFPSSRDLLLRYNHWLSLLSACVVSRSYMAQAIADAPTSNVWAPFIWFSLAGRGHACAVAPHRLLFAGGTERGWAGQYDEYMTTRIIKAFDAGLRLVISEHEYGRLLDERYAKYGADLWRGATVDELIGVVARFPTSRLIRETLANVARVHGRHDAFATIDQAVRESGDDVASETLVAEGEQLFLGGDVGGATKRFEAALREHPVSTAAWCDLGVALHAAGSPAALEAFDRTLEIDPDHFDALVNRGMWTLGFGLRAQAAHDAQRALELQPESAQALELLASTELPSSAAPSA